MQVLVELREFLANVRFARPNILWLLLAPLVFTLIRRWIVRRDRYRMANLGRPGAIAALRTGFETRPFLARSLLLLAWLAAAIAVAGPRWGQDDERGIAVGRDLVLVFDFSRSMWAEDMADRRHPARWQAAIASARDLIDELRGRGGNRVAVVVFAARPTVIVPLTTDYDHVVFRLDELDATIPPAEIRPADDTATSGTRIGAALAAAVEAHDPRFPGFQDIVLLTDGDDPAADGEWRTGATLARRAGIPVYVVGLGDPASESFILWKGTELHFNDKNGVPVQVQTRLHEDVAETIAKETRGTYLPSRLETPDLRSFFRSSIQANPTRELDDERLPQPRERYGPFALAAMALLALAWMRER